MTRPYRSILFMMSILIAAACSENDDATPDVPTTSEKDRHVLIEIFKQNIDNTLGWDTTETDLRLWSNLVITEDGNVSALYLDNKGLATLPSEIGTLEHLTIMDVSDNELTSLPAAIGNLKKLEQLNASWNHLTAIPVEIAGLTEMELLILHHNDITAVPVEIGQLSNLRWLYLHDNKLSSVPEELSQLTKLESLSIQNNLITVLPQAVCDWVPTLALSFHVDQGVGCE